MTNMKRIYLLPNVLTALALTCGLFAIFKLNMTEIGEANQSVLDIATGLILLAALFDLMDGAVARILNAESEFGGIFDSLADAISFGVAPSVIILKSLSVAPGTIYSFLITTSAIVYSICGVLRLVRFNVMAMHEKNDESLQLASKKNFTGLPIPAAAAAAISLNMFLVSSEFASMITLTDHARTLVLFFALLILGYFMVCRWKFPSLKQLRLRVGSFQTVFFIVVIAVFLFYAVLHHFVVTFFTISWGYVLVAWILSIVRVIAGRSTKSLEDFEPEPDDEEMFHPH